MTERAGAAEHSDAATASPSAWALTRTRPPARRPEGLDGLVDKLARRCRRGVRPQRRLLAAGSAAAQHMAGLTQLPEPELAQRRAALAESFRCGSDRAGKSGRACRQAALAVLAETLRRQLGLRPFPVQLAAALAVEEGFLAEMATGEGKTLAVALAGVLAGWRGRPVHLVTANDYLAQRDASAMAAFYAECGLAVGTVTGDMAPDRRQAAYGCDIVYATAKELLGDFLRDRMASGGTPEPHRLAFARRRAAGNGPSQVIQVRGLHTAIVDEADSVLIDEAVTPLIVSSPRANHDLDRAVRLAATIAEGLVAERDYQTVPKERSIRLGDGARAAIAAQTEALPPLWRARPRREALLHQALFARHFLERDRHYVVQDDKVILLDDFTGRMTPNRSLSAGLHQALEAAEGVPITDPTEPVAQMSFQTFFRHFPRLAGTTGTAAESAREFWAVYGLPVLPVPTHRPNRRRHRRARVFVDEASRQAAVLAEIHAAHGTGRPVLVGVRSVRASEALGEQLAARGLDCQCLNAVRHAEEAEIVARAGEVGRITVATNMAGRGTDIKLGPGAAERGGLYVIVTEAHSARRIDRQLHGRCARQGDPGGTATFLSLEDEVLHRYLPELVRRGLAVFLNRSWPGNQAIARVAVRYAQRMAEAHDRQRRYAVQQSDRWLADALPFDEGARGGAMPLGGA